jgi:ABC-type methionine transport system permease subunit
MRQIIKKTSKFTQKKWRAFSQASVTYFRRHPFISLLVAFIIFVMLIIASLMFRQKPEEVVTASFICRSLCKI